MVKWSRKLPVQPRRDAWVEVDLGALEANATRIFSRLSPALYKMAIVKADSYGHGSVMVAPVLLACGTDWLGVASIDEAIQLREAGIEAPILVIGAVPDWAIPVALDYDICLTVFTENHLQVLASLSQTQPPGKKRLSVHVKVDTGMHRIGVPVAQAFDYIQRLSTLPMAKLDGVFSHFAFGDQSSPCQKQVQALATLLESLKTLPTYRHVANTAGALFHGDVNQWVSTNPESGKDGPLFNLVRIGLGLFGYWGEVPPAAADLPKLQPVMDLKARIVHLQTVSPGDGVSYGHTYQVGAAATPRRVATLPLGYADGVPRGLSNRFSVLVQGQQVPQIGTITMDQLMIDVTDVPSVQVGSVVTLLGTDGAHTVTLSDWAKVLGTIEYEVMCGLRVRLPKVYTR